MRWPALTSCTPIGLDVGGQSLKAVQLRPAGRGWRVHAASCLPRIHPCAPLEREEMRQLWDILHRQGFSGRRAVMAAPPELLLTGLLELPPTGAAPLDQMVRMEFARMHGCDPQSFEVLFWILPESSAKKTRTQVRAVGCRHEQAEGLLDVVENGRLTVTLLETSSCALTRACASLLAGRAGICALLDLGWNAARMAVLYRGTVVYERHMHDRGLRQLAGALGEKSGVEAGALDAVLRELHLEAPPGGGDGLEPVRAVARAYFTDLADEVRTPLDYVKQQYRDAPVDHVLLVGGGAATGGVAHCLGPRLDVEVRTVSPADLSACPGGLLARCGSPALTTAFGLAQGAA